MYRYLDDEDLYSYRRYVITMVWTSAEKVDLKKTHNFLDCKAKINQMTIKTACLSQGTGALLYLIILKKQ